MPSALAAMRSAFCVTSNARVSSAVTLSSIVVTRPLPYSLNEPMLPPGYDSYTPVINPRPPCGSLGPKPGDLAEEEQ